MQIDVRVFVLMSEGQIVHTVVVPEEEAADAALRLEQAGVGLVVVHSTIPDTFEAALLSLHTMHAADDPHCTCNDCMADFDPTPAGWASVETSVEETPVPPTLAVSPGAQAEFERIASELEAGHRAKTYRLRTGELVTSRDGEWPTQYTNRTQANNAAAKIAGAQVIHRGRPFYVQVPEGGAQ